MRNIFRIIIIFLMLFVLLVFFGILYSGGSIDLGGLRFARVRPASLVIIFCILYSLFSLIKKPIPFKDALAENSLIFLTCLVLIVYLGNFRTLSASDTVPARYLPLSILREGDFDLDEFRNLHPRAEVTGLVRQDEHYVSSYPVGAPLLAVPFYILTAIGNSPANSWFPVDLEKLAASVIVTMSVVLFYFTALLLTSRRMAVLISIIYALGTSSLSVSSQALWQHGASQLSLTAALYCLIRGSKESQWTLLAGLPAAFAVVCRPTDALLIIPMGLYVLFHQIRKLPGFMFSSLPAIAFQLLYNYFYFDNVFRTQWRVTEGWFWSTPLMDGAKNILFSPARGLFIYSPIFLFSMIGMIFAWKKGGTLLLRYLSVGVIATLSLYSTFFMWWGGATYGPRLLADLSPILCLFLCEIKTLLAKRAAKIVFAILVVFSITAHAIGAYADDRFWNADMIIDFNPHRAWQWTDNQLVNAPKRMWNAAKIGIWSLPTTASNPELFDAVIRTEPSNFIFIRPLKALSLKIWATNSGRSVWLHGSMEKEGTVILLINWHRRGKLIDRFSIRRRIRYQVFPNESYFYDLGLIAPEKEGRYDLEVVLGLSQKDSLIPRKSLLIPVRVSR